MKISVAMCTYNGAEYLQQQLDSLELQTQQPFELVICDDRSTDATEEIVRRFSSSVRFPVRFSKNEANLGSTANFSQAIRLCHGDLIALCDQDDVWHPERLKKQAAQFEQDATLGGSVCDGDLIDANSTPLNLSLWNSQDFTTPMRKDVSAGKTAGTLVRQNFVTGAAFMFRASLRQHIFPIPEEWIHDAWIAWMLSLHSRLCLLPAQLIHYRIHARQQIGANPQSLSDRFRRDTDLVIQRHGLELRRMKSLEERLRTERAAGAADSLELVRGKESFLQTRIELLQKRPVFRLFGLATNIRGYMRFAKGSKSLLGDLLL